MNEPEVPTNPTDHKNAVAEILDALRSGDLSHEHTVDAVFHLLNDWTGDDWSVWGGFDPTPEFACQIIDSVCLALDYPPAGLTVIDGHFNGSMTVHSTELGSAPNGMGFRSFSVTTDGEVWESTDPTYVGPWDCLVTDGVGG